MRRLLFSLLVLMLLVAAAPTVVRAEDDRRRPAPVEKDYVGQLTDADIAYLRGRGIDWDALDAHKKQRIAHGIVMMRNMTPEQREELEERFKRLSGEEKPRIKDLRAGGPARRDQLARHMGLARGLGLVAQETLSEAERHVFEGLRLRPGQAELAFYKRFWERVVASEVANILDTDLSSIPERMRPHVAKKIERIRASDDPRQKEQMLRGLTQMVLGLQVQKLVESVKRPDMSDVRVASDDPHARRVAFRAKKDEYGRTVAALVRDHWKQPFDETVSEFKGATHSPEALKTLIEKHGKPPYGAAGSRRGLGDPRSREFKARLIQMLEMAAPIFRKDGDASAHADALQKDLLIKGLGIPEDEVLALPDRRRGPERMHALTMLLRKHKAVGAPGNGRARDDRRKPRDRGPGRPGGGSGKDGRR